MNGNGFVDLAATLRLPRAPDEESARDLAKAAAAGGVDVVVVSVKGAEAKDEDGATAVAAACAVGREHGVTLVPSLCPIADDGGLADITAMVKALPAGTPRVLRLRAPVDDALLLRRIGDLARALGALVMLPSTDRALAAGTIAVEGAVATRLGFAAIPEASERIGIARVVEIARLTGARFHVAGVFTAAGAAAVDAARADGVAVSGSVFAPHLLLDEGALLACRYDTRVLHRPPLPTSTSRAALIAAVARGALVVASGHHHVPKRERDLEMAKAGPGMTALSSTAALLRPVLGDALRAAFHTGPAAILGVTRATAVAEAVDVVGGGAGRSDDLARLCDDVSRALATEAAR